MSEPSRRSPESLKVAWSRVAVPLAVATPLPQSVTLRFLAWIPVTEPLPLPETGRQSWPAWEAAVGLSLKYGGFIAWPVVLLKRPWSKTTPVPEGAASEGRPRGSAELAPTLFATSRERGALTGWR